MVWKTPTIELMNSRSPWEGFILENFKKDCLPEVVPQSGSGEEGASEQEEGVSEQEEAQNELTATHIPHPAAPSGAQVENLGEKLRL